MSARGFIAAFAGVALSFMGATAYAQHVQMAIDHAVTQITTNAAPSVEHLGEARTALRNLQMLLYHYATSDRPDRAQIDAVVRARAEYRRAIEAYVALPAFPGERELWTAVEREIAASDARLTQVEAHLQRDDFAGARALFRDDLPETERAILAISRTIKFNVTETRRLAESIEATRSRAMVIERALDGVSAALTLMAGLLLFRAVRHYTALLQAHQRLTERRADELEQFAGRVAHDILSPLSATGMALAIADKGLPEGSPARSAIARGNASLTRVQRIVAGLLDFARAGAQPSPDACAEVAPIIDDILTDVRAAATERAIEVIVEPFEPCAVACSPGILMSLCSNLLRNAIKYMDERPERRITVRVRPRRDRVRFEIADTGPGIAEHLLGGIFEPYVRGATSGQPGIGLGLATVKRIAETHRGEVGVRSSLGRGSEFWFELPRIGAAP